MRSNKEIKEELEEVEKKINEGNYTCPTEDYFLDTRQDLLRLEIDRNKIIRDIYLILENPTRLLVNFLRLKRDLRDRYGD